MIDIVERLTREADAARRADGTDSPLGDDLRQAAAEITRLRALVEEMGKALEPFALHAECWPHEQDFDLLTTSDEDGNAASRDFTVGDLRRARATLAKAKE